MMLGPNPSANAVYDLKFHFVWTPKLQKEILIGEAVEATKKLRIERYPRLTFLDGRSPSGAVHVIHDDLVCIEEKI